MHFENLKSGDIVLSASQTKQLLELGRATGHGKPLGSARAYAQGSVFEMSSAFSSGSGSFQGGAGNGKDGSSSSSSNNNKPSNSNTTSTNNNTKATNDNTEALEDLKDWIEVLRDRIDRTLEQQKEYIDTLSHRNDQSREIDEYVAQAQNAISKLQEAENYYLVRASQLGLSEAYVEKIRNGTIEIEQIADEKLKEKVEQYQEWYEKALDLQDQVHDLNLEIRELRLQKFDNIIDDFDKLVSFHEGILDLNDAVNSLSEKEIGVGQRDTLLNNLQQQEAIMKYRSQQVKELSQKLEDYVKYGVITEYSEEWIEMNNAIREAQAAFYDVKLEVWGTKDAIREIDFKELTDAIDDLEHAEDIISSIKDLISDEVIFEKDSNVITELGYTKLGLISQQLLGAKKEVENYTKLIEALHRALENGEITQADYNEQLKEYESAQMDAVNSAKDYKDAILDVVKNGIEKQTEAMDELIQKRKEDLSLQKEYYDFQKEMNDKSKDMNSIRAQIAALEGDDSLEAEQKRKKLQSQLKQLQEEYDETLKEHEFNTVQDAYDKLSEKINENKDDVIYTLDTDLEAQNKAIAEILNSVRKNYTDVYKELNKLAEEYGYTMSESLTKPWVDAGNALEHYIDVVGEEILELKGTIGSKRNDSSSILGHSNLKPLDMDYIYGKFLNMINPDFDKTFNVPNVTVPSGIMNTASLAAGDINVDINYTIDNVDKNVLPDLETILEKSTEHTISVLKKYNRR